jgi:hypothetical protein
MLQDWKNLPVNEIRNNKKLWADFQLDYKKYIGKKINSCHKCLMEKHYELLKAINNLTGEQPQKQIIMSNYVLKSKYNPIIFNNVVYRNGTSTDKEFAFLGRKHTAGNDLFEKVPFENDLKKKDEGILKNQKDTHTKEDENKE